MRVLAHSSATRMRDTELGARLSAYARRGIDESYLAEIVVRVALPSFLSCYLPSFPPVYTLHHLVFSIQTISLVNSKSARAIYPLPFCVRNVTS